MGILEEPLAFIRALKLKRGFSVCELGDQYVTAKPRRYLASEFYQGRGCGRYVSIDGNGRGTHTFDLNVPLPADFGRFDLVTDFGTGEHVFNQFQVFKSIHYLMRPKGGLFAFDRPTQGYAEHCYWNAHECLWRDLAEANHYQVLRLEKRVTVRGELIRGVFRRVGDRKFVVPQQSRYRKLLRPITGLR